MFGAMLAVAVVAFCEVVSILAVPVVALLALAVILLVAVVEYCAGACILAVPVVVWVVVVTNTGVQVPLAVNVQMSFPPDVVYVPPAVVGFDTVPVGAEIITTPEPPAPP